MSKSTMSRRALVAGAATAATMIPAIATGTTPDDPIFAALERHRQCDDAYCAALEAEKPDALVFELGEERHEALFDLVSTTPTTVAGCAAVLRFAETVNADFEDTIFENVSEVDEPGRDFLSRIAATLEKAVQS